MHDHVVEAFAGSAGYATRYNAPHVTLIEKNPKIAGICKYLTRVPPREILALPDVPLCGSVDDVAACEEARWLIGMWLNKGVTSPRKTPSAWMCGSTSPGNFWGPGVRERIASQVDQIAHWRVVEGSYADEPSHEATWIVDPPYQVAGTHYTIGAKTINFEHLAAWTRSRPGVVFAHENEGATWLPFEPWVNAKGTEGRRGGKVSREALYVQLNGEQVLIT